MSILIKIYNTYFIRAIRISRSNDPLRKGRRNISVWIVPCLDRIMKNSSIKKWKVCRYRWIRFSELTIESSVQKLATMSTSPSPSMSALEILFGAVKDVAIVTKEESKYVLGILNWWWRMSVFPPPAVPTANFMHTDTNKRNMLFNNRSICYDTPNVHFTWVHRASCCYVFCSEMIL